MSFQSSGVKETGLSDFHNAHMKRTRLRNHYLQKCSEQNRLSYVKQRNCCVSLLRKTKKDYYANLNVKDIVDIKQFWRTVKSLFSDKTKLNKKITLVEDETVTMQDEQNAEPFLFKCS